MTLKDALNGELSSWKGLSGTETIESLTEQLQPVDRISAPEARQRTYRRFTCSIFERSVAPVRVEAWVVYGEDGVALIEYKDPPAFPLEETLREFGEPDLIRSDDRFAADATVREYIYARRGVTFSVAEPFEASGRGERRVTHVQLFPATTLELYLSDIGVSADARPNTNP